MTDVLNPKEIISQAELPNGDSIVLLDRLGKGGLFSKEDVARNIFRVDGSRRIKWQVKSRFDAEGNPFTQLHCDGGRITAYRWDGGAYQIDVSTGEATPNILQR